MKENDPKGFNILNVIINQTSNNVPQGSPTSQMTDKEALSILGLQNGANSKEIKKAYYDLMKKFHPDKDGNNYLSNLITEAKNKLLNE